MKCASASIDAYNPANTHADAIQAASDIDMRGARLTGMVQIRDQEFPVLTLVGLSRAIWIANLTFVRRKQERDNSQPAWVREIASCKTDNPKTPRRFPACESSIHAKKEWLTLRAPR